ncbi:MAG: hypothetical protein WKF42_02645 [Solirubrobacteraceae bacterium]
MPRVPVAGSELHVERCGAGAALLLIRGMGADGSQAERVNR